LVSGSDENGDDSFHVVNRQKKKKIVPKVPSSDVVKVVHHQNTSWGNLCMELVESICGYMDGATLASAAITCKRFARGSCLTTVWRKALLEGFPQAFEKLLKKEVDMDNVNTLRNTFKRQYLLEVYGKREAEQKLKIKGGGKLRNGKRFAMCRLDLYGYGTSSYV